MSEALREQRPLLCEEQSEEEHFPEYPRRYRPLYLGRARNAAKGATTIITRWPEHWSSAFTYWWLGLSMMALSIFAIYNIVIAFALFPTANMKPAKPLPSNEIDFSRTSHLPEIFIHFIVNNYDEVDIDKYIPYIEIMSDKYYDYNFNLILLFNDTAQQTTIHSAEENNENVLNSLWSKDQINQINNQKPKSRKNIKIRQESLIQFMSDSPLGTEWRRVAPHLMNFVVKAVSIWEKGGIAINPEILTPRSPNIMYIEKFHHVLNKFKNINGNIPFDQKSKKYSMKQKDKFRKKVNNIRDIINIIEHENNNNDSQEILIEAENVNSPNILHNGRKLLSKVSNDKLKSEYPNFVELPQIPLISSSNDTEGMDHRQFYLSDIRPHDEASPLEIVNGNFNILDDNREEKLGLLPLFLEFLFHDKPNVLKKKEIDNLARHRKSTMNKESRKKKNMSVSFATANQSSEVNETETYKPVIVTSKDVVSDTLPKIENNKDFQDPDELTIDLKGNILATKASCHAFIGTLFSNIVHHPLQKSLQDFIIAELSYFCKGFLSSCRGIDVILV